MRTSTGTDGPMGAAVTSGSRTANRLHSPARWDGGMGGAAVSCLACDRVPLCNSGVGGGATGGVAAPSCMGSGVGGWSCRRSGGTGINDLHERNG